MYIHITLSVETGAVSFSKKLLAIGTCFGRTCWQGWTGPFSKVETQDEITNIHLWIRDGCLMDTRVSKMDTCVSVHVSTKCQLMWTRGNGL